MGQVLAPENIPDLAIATTTTISMAATYLGKDTRITIGGQQYKYSSLTTLNFATTGFNGLDTGAIAANTLYYIYAVRSGLVPGLVASLSAPGTGPAGFASWKEIGRCRSFLAGATLAAIVNRVGGSQNLSGTDWAAVASPSSLLSGLTLGNGTASAFQRRTLSNLDFKFEVISGTSTSYSSPYIWTLPSGFSFDTNIGAMQGTFGDAYGLVTASSNVHRGACYRTAATAFRALKEDGAAAADWGSLVPATWAAATAGQRLSVNVSIAIAEYIGLI